MADDEVVCPACDLPIDPDAISCPGCGADFTMQGIDELELVARDLSAPEAVEATEEPSTEAQAVSEEAASIPAEASASPSLPSNEPPRATEQKKRRFPRLFGRS